MALIGTAERETGELAVFPDTRATRHAAGNAYFVKMGADDDTRDSAIQIQVKAIHRTLGIGENEIFAAQFISFGSRDLASLSEFATARAFAMRLWAWVVEQSPAQLIYEWEKRLAVRLAPY